MLQFTSTPPSLSQASTLAIPVCEDADIHADPEILELIARAKAIEEFSGEKDQQIIFYDRVKDALRRRLLIGVGPRKTITAETLRRFAGRAIQQAMGAKSTTIAIVAPAAELLDIQAPTVCSALFEGACLANHAFTHYKEKPKQNLLKDIAVLVSNETAKKYKALPARIAAICQGTLMARDWVNTPANDKLPEQLAKAFESAARQSGLHVKILDQAQLKRQKFNALLAVAAGSAHAPRLVEMVYAPRKPERTIVLVGKGVTFDTGGLNIKPSAGLQAMKGDMAGAAAVAGAMTALALLKPKQRVIGITPIVENMPSGSATRPGDIITSYAGKTVEIGNTDAEGRLILADALAYAIKTHKPDIIIDLATLTGACVVALGEKMAGVFSADDDLAGAIVAAGETTFERCWRMPLLEDYKELLKSDLADISNMPNTRYGGAITAALFLSEFTTGARWAHIDIAGPAASKKGNGYCTPGGTGFGVRLLCELLTRL
jgi:leucyl aminopeptidase